MSFHSAVPIYTYYNGTVANTTAWKVVPLSSATFAQTDIHKLEVFSDSGGVLELGIGASTGAAVTLQYCVIPGGTTGAIDVLLNTNVNLYMRAPIANCTGAIVFNFMR